MTKLSDRLGRIPYHYAIEDESDWQATIKGPAGRAVISRCVDADRDVTYEIETSFDGQSALMHYGPKTGEAAMIRLVELNNQRLKLLGKPIPADLSPRGEKAVTLAVLGVLVGLAALVIVGIVYLFGGGDDGPAPAPPTPRGPVVQVTIYGPQGKYTGEECEALRLVALSDSPKAQDALVQYEVHCKTKRILDSPAPVATR